MSYKETIGTKMVTAFGSTASVLGLVGAGCASGCGGTGLLLGITSSLVGVGTARYLHEHSNIFLFVGLVFLFLGIVLILKNKFNSNCKKG